MLNRVIIHRITGEVEVFTAYAPAAERLGMSAASLRVALSAGGGEIRRRATPIGTVIVEREQRPKRPTRARLRAEAAAARKASR